jgi:inward rectifier potassium channel
MMKHLFSQKRFEKARINDPGFGEKVADNAKRIINKDGTFNIHRDHEEMSAQSAYQFLLEISTGKFFFLVLFTFVVINVMFAAIYFSIGTHNLIGVHGETPIEHFMDCFYFSTQTFTTVGYGAIAPKGFIASSIASFEAMLGLLTFALATGLLYARFSKPKALLKFSENALIAPYEEGTALMFRFANRRSNVLMNMTARVILMMREPGSSSEMRKYFELELEIKEIMILALSWTLVHPISESSPIAGLNAQDLIDNDAELLILISGFDETFNQTVHTRYSYIASEFVWNAKFKKAFYTNNRGDLQINLEDVGAYEQL